VIRYRNTRRLYNSPLIKLKYSLNNYARESI
jgi:hypothetical protein